MAWLNESFQRAASPCSLQSMAREQQERVPRAIQSRGSYGGLVPLPFRQLKISHAGVTGRLRCIR